MNLSEKTLYDFRTRIYKYLIKHPEQEDLVFGQFLNLTMIFAKEAGICMKEQRIDSTMFMSNIKKAGRVALAFDVLYRAVKSIPEDRLSENLKKVLNPEFRTEVIHKTKPSEGESRLEMLLNLCQETKETIENISELKNSDAGACAKCEFKNQCYCKEQKKDYVVRVNLKSIEAAKQREKIECRCEGNKGKRAAIEGTNSALKRGHGLSKLRVRGLVKCRVNVGLKVLAQNFKRFARYMLERAKKAIAESQGGSAPVLVQ